MRISIVTPSFNQAQFLEQTIRSIVDQQFDGLEYVVIDGGSTDGSVDILKRYDSKLAYWVSERDGGHGNALNKGFRRTTGEVMAWLNSDDLYLPWTLRTVAEIFANHPEVSWITGINTQWDHRGRIVNAFQNFKNKYDFLLGGYAWIQQESTFWRRSLWDAAGGQLNEDYKFMVDGELWTRFFLKAPLYHVMCILGGFRQWGGNRSTASIDLCHAEMRRCIAAMAESCDSHTRSNFVKLRHVSGLSPGLIRRISRKMLHLTSPALTDETAYDVLTLQGDAWRCQKRPFPI